MAADGRAPALQRWRFGVEGWAWVWGGEGGGAQGTSEEEEDGEAHCFYIGYLLAGW